MFNPIPARYWFAGGLFGGAIAIAIMLTIGYGSAWDAFIAEPIVFGSMAGLMVLLSLLASFLVLSQALDEQVQGVARSAVEALTDDVQALSKGRITWPHVLSVVTVLCAGTFIYLVFKFQKFSATWSVVPVGLVVIAGVGLLTYAITSTEWFHDRDFYTPWGWGAFVICGFILAVFLGINQTEDVRRIQLGTEQARSTTYAHVYMPRYYNSYGSSSTTSGDSIDLPECEGKGCGYAVLALILVVVVLILVLGSAFIPHFWFLAGSLLLTIMVTMAIRELLVVERSRNYLRNYYN